VAGRAGRCVPWDAAALTFSTRGQLRLAQAGIGALSDDDYGRLIRNGLARLAALL
jgi:hypothetical protein